LGKIRVFGLLLKGPGDFWGDSLSKKLQNFELLLSKASFFTFLPYRAVSKHGLLEVYEEFKSGLMLMFWHFLPLQQLLLLFPKFGRIFSQSSGHPASDLNCIVRVF
jgi:hypothetical protein